ncbi:MAG TPA: M23 family metallopeptidase [Kofleriaceae bacterium]|nr:M23 family metallopeptidase [Kofleriaceae bacterium]
MRHAHGIALACSLLVAAPAAAAASPGVTVMPRAARPGDPVLVTVTGAHARPSGKAAGAPLRFFRAMRGYQAVFAIPLDREPGEMSIDIDAGGAEESARVHVRAHEFPEASVIVEEEYADPDPSQAKLIDADNHAIREALRAADGVEPRFTRRFQRPTKGRETSGFGEWRTINDGHRSQHLGVDLAAREGARVHAVNDGTVVLVRDCFLAGKVVVVSHGGGIASAYFHLSEPLVAEGDVVRRGRVVGRAGHTGRTTGPHVHLSIWTAGNFVEPTSFLRLPIHPRRARGTTTAATW